MRAALRRLALVPLVTLTACAEPEAEVDAAAPAAEVAAEAAAPTVDAAAVRRDIEAINTQHAEAFNRGDIAGFSQVYTEDARILPPGMAPVEGRESIQQFWTGGAQQMGIKDLRLTTDELEVNGDQAYEQGRFQFTGNDGPHHGRYVVIWKRTPEGWRWHRDIWNESPA